MATSVTPKKIDRSNFFNKVRASFFNGKLSTKQVNGMTAILNEWESRTYLSDLRRLAYMLATTYHETAKTMQPIEEYGTTEYFNKRYGPQTKVGKALGNINEGDGALFKGRGYVQLTGRRNYKLFDLEKTPELATKLTVATDILFDGMINGLFTGKKLSDYFTDKALVNHEEMENNWVNARRIINSLDKAELIADYGKKFLTTLA